jgi:O-antigen/teichoic acid export membrane protein
MNKYLRAVSDNFIFFAIHAIFFLAITPVAMRIMGEEFYGLWAVLSALMLFSNVGNLGIGAIMMKFASETTPRSEIQTRPNRIMTAGYLIVFAMSIIIVVFLLLARELISENIHMSAELRGQFPQALGWIAASIFPQFLARVPHGFLLSQLRNQTVRRIELVSSISLWLGAVLIASIDKNLATVAAWCFLSNLLVLGIYFWTLRRFVTFRFQLDRVILQKMLDFSGYMFLETLAIALFQHFDKIIVGITLGPVMAGVYSVGTSLALRLSMVTGQATEVMIPYASLQESLGDQRKLYRVFRQLSRYISLAIAGMGSILILWMDELLSIWISSDYAARSANGFRILIIAYGILSLTRPAHQTLTGTGKVKLTGLIYLFVTIVMLAGMFLFSREFGFLGAVASNLILVFLLVLNLFLYSAFEVSSPWKHALADLKWGLFLPVLAYGLSLFLSSSPLTYKILETIVLGILLAWGLVKEYFILIKTGFLQLKQVVSRS